MALNLENVVGFKVQITNVLDAVTEGFIYSFNSQNNTITLQVSRKNQSRKSFKIINCQFIKTLKVIGEKPPNNLNTFKKTSIRPSQVNLNRVDQYLNEQLTKNALSYRLKGKNVSIEGQAIFDALYKTFSDTKWIGSKIIVLDNVEIVEPYKFDSVKALNENDHTSADSIDMVKRIVQRSWEDLNAAYMNNNVLENDDVYDDDDNRKGG
ncbi:hypothetical protein TPHA_0I01420 [Tetrapisispora phaffii CBS 4417]|uniref:AD domain-containing protein n=1 Tax=Tetrapisispora phaffii (strain ATCC 24235 / CBS 4417 / NBRC 1672 / NRRL Y-8282 / UCD 70-5) TaxID=1071381 RepID=G8BXM0_TETPH|nr:hypothetical protein TPHA_0I01420 [Tetrapisispora phaffii CBS 4417]CCE64648.1 hypothetical protein TPHA_0I01420 [Tetrapisispora phaffii CBS 4417]